MRYAAKWPQYAAWWNAMLIKPSKADEFEKLANFALGHKSAYAAIEEATGVPWELVAVLHRRESNANFNTYLGNGEPLNRKTRKVPKGRGPFIGENAFVDGAVDALHIDGLDSVKDW